MKGEHLHPDEEHRKQSQKINTTNATLRIAFNAKRYYFILRQYMNDA